MRSWEECVPINGHVPFVETSSRIPSGTVRTDQSPISYDIHNALAYSNTPSRTGRDNETVPSKWFDVNKMRGFVLCTDHAMTPIALLVERTSWPFKGAFHSDDNAISRIQLLLSLTVRPREPTSLRYVTHVARYFGVR